MSVPMVGHVVILQYFSTYLGDPDRENIKITYYGPWNIEIINHLTKNPSLIKYCSFLWEIFYKNLNRLRGNHNKNSDFKIVLYRNPSCRRTSDRKIRCIYFWTMFCRDNNIMEKMHHKDYKSLIYHKDSIHSWLGFVFLRLFIFKYHLIRKCVGILNFNSSIAVKQIPTYLSRYIYKS